MRQSLRLHPDSRSAAAQSVEVDVSVPRSGNLVLQYVVTGTMNDLRMPSASAPTRADDLWEHTCFEAFVQAPPAAGYYEFNFSPSTQWAAYRFSGYRNGKAVASEFSAPRIDVHLDAARYEMQASLDLDRLPGLPDGATWHLGLSAVIEEKSGNKSYWALAHPPGKPDFHHADCFAQILQTADQS